MKVRDVNFPPIPKLSNAWSEAVKPLNTWFQSFRDYIAAQEQTRIVEIDFVAPATPSLVVRLGARPIGVELMALWVVGGSNSLTTKAPNAALSWSFNDGTLTLPSLTGITPSGTYRAVVRITEAK